MAYIVSHTYWDLEEQLVDHYELCETEVEAHKKYEACLDKDETWCAAISLVLDATEPQWKDT